MGVVTESVTVGLEGAESIAALERLDGPVDVRDRELMTRLTKAELETWSTLLERVGELE